MKQEQIVQVQIEESATGLFYATSSDLKGLLVAELTLDALNSAIPRAIAGLFRAQGMNVVVKANGGDAWYVEPVSSTGDTA